MNAIKLRIGPDGSVRGLWTDAVDWRDLGHLSVRRASHVEFYNRGQQWRVRLAQPRGWLRRVLQRFTGQRWGEVVYCSISREEALAWERRYFEDSHDMAALRKGGEHV